MERSIYAVRQVDMLLKHQPSTEAVVIKVDGMQAMRLSIEEARDLQSSLAECDLETEVKLREVGFYWGRWVTLLGTKLPPEIAYWNGSGWVFSINNGLRDIQFEAMGGPLKPPEEKNPIEGM